MYLKTIHVKNFRLLKDVKITFDQELTLLVGKNNSGKTSLMNIMELALSEQNGLPFDDYPIECRQKLYKAVKDYWNESESATDALQRYTENVPLTSVTMEIDYAEKDTLGALSGFIIDLDENVHSATIRAVYKVSDNIESILGKCRDAYNLISDKAKSNSVKDEIIAQIVKEYFLSFFQLQILAIDPTNLTNTAIKSKTDLKNIFYLKTIRAERSLDESDAAPVNPLGQVMKKLLGMKPSDIEDEIKPSIVELQKLIADVNYNVQSQVNEQMNKLVNQMTPFGYPDGEDLQLKANTTLSIENRIVDSTGLTYLSQDGSETLPESHNGLGYKNLIKISMELHAYAREIKSGPKRISLLFIEEPEAHMHPQLQTTFVGFLTEFLNREADNNAVQTVITTHSPHIANTVQFFKVRYIRRFRDCVECKDLAEFPISAKTEEEKAQQLEFLQKYMKLSYCDLYFCDKAILVEGASERLLLPDMIRKCDQDGLFGENSLMYQYYSIVEVGGAYAHLFYDFLDYLKIPALIITDIDFVNNNSKACQKSEAKNTSNGAIKRWCHDVYSIAVSNQIPFEKVLELCNDSKKKVAGLRCIEFQQEENGYHPRSLEESIINVNRDLFNKEPEETLDFANENEGKTDFAVNLLYDPKFENYRVPSYIREGLVWLSKVSRYEKGEEPPKMHKRQYTRKKETVQ